MDEFKDLDGATWQPFVDEYQRRKLRNVATGAVVDDPRLGPPPETRRPGVRIAHGADPGLFPEG